MSYFDSIESENEFHCDNCGDTGWDWVNAITEDGYEYSLLVPCDCTWCMGSASSIEGPEQ